MNARKLVAHVVALVFFVVAASGFSMGRPPVTQDPDPGITASQAV